jgi:hypothetical protein
MFFSGCGGGAILYIMIYVYYFYFAPRLFLNYVKLISMNERMNMVSVACKAAKAVRKYILATFEDVSEK